MAEKEGPFSMIHVRDHTDSPDKENSFEIQGWSSDGNVLLATTVTAAGDWDETTPAIYSAKESTLWVVPLAPIFRNRKNPPCDLSFWPLGFTPKGKIVFEAGALDEPYLNQGEKPCFERSFWTLDYINKTVARLPSNTPFEAIGKVQQLD